MKNSKSLLQINRYIIILGLSTLLCSGGLAAVSKVKILIGGDTLIGGYYNTQAYGTMDELGMIMDQRYKDCGAKCCAEYFQSDITPIIDEADFTWVNLEGPITPALKNVDYDSVFVEKTIPLRQYEHTAEIIEMLGIDLVSLANNHSHDYLKNTGLKYTVSALEDKVAMVGAGIGLEAYNPHVLDLNGISVGLFGISDVVDPASLGYGLDELITAVIPDTTNYMQNYRFNKFLEKLKLAQSETDFTVVYVHYGPVRGQTVTGRQQELTQILLDQGVDVIVGTSSHAAQPIQEIKNRDGQLNQIVFYGLGNFIFGGRRSVQEKGLLVELEFEKELDKKSIAYRTYRISPNPDGSFIPRLVD